MFAGLNSSFTHLKICQGAHNLSTLTTCVLEMNDCIPQTNYLFIDFMMNTYVTIGMSFMIFFQTSNIAVLTESSASQTLDGKAFHLISTCRSPK